MAAATNASATKSGARLRWAAGAAGAGTDVLVELANGAAAAVDAGPVALSGVAVAVATVDGEGWDAGSGIVPEI